VILPAHIVPLQKTDNLVRLSNVLPLSRERVPMAARLSALTLWHNNSAPGQVKAIDRGTPVTASRVGCNVLLGATQLPSSPGRRTTQLD
jgi:hypothetical protein